jgi:drug/metabolite transporter (DMT)-like permease
LIWGFTGILGGIISLDSFEITFFRTGIAFVSLVLLAIFYKPQPYLSFKQILWLLGTGAIVGLHWITFFYSIQVSTISIAVVCMSGITLFTSILEPLIFKRPYYISEFILSVVVTVGVIIIFGFETKYSEGLAVGLFSAFLSSLFCVLNGTFVKTMPSASIARYEMLGGFITTAVFMLASGNLNAATFTVPAIDWVWLSILAIVCTSFAFITSIWVMKYVTPFTVSISVNMEPVYTILIALVIDWSMGTRNEQMTGGFYVGGSIIIAAIFIHAWLKTRPAGRITQEP